MKMPMKMTGRRLSPAVIASGLGYGSEREFLGLYADERERGKAFGWYHLALSD